MILEFIFNLIKNLLTVIISLLPTLEFNVFTTVGGLIPWLINIVASVSYFLPMHDLALMFAIWIMIHNFNIAWKMIQRIWDALPFT